MAAWTARWLRLLPVGGCDATTADRSSEDGTGAVVCGRAGAGAVVLPTPGSHGRVHVWGGRTSDGCGIRAATDISLHPRLEAWTVQGCGAGFKRGANREAVALHRLMLGHSGEGDGADDGTHILVAVGNTCSSRHHFLPPYGVENEIGMHVKPAEAGGGGWTPITPSVMETHPVSKYAPTPVARLGCATCSRDKRIFLFGGVTSAAHVAHAQALRNGTGAPTPGVGADATPAYLNDMFYASWSGVAGMASPTIKVCTNIMGRPPPSRAFASMAIVDARTYRLLIHGGMNASGALADVHLVELAGSGGMAWSTPTCMGVPLPPRLRGCMHVVEGDGDATTVIIFGGRGTATDAGQDGPRAAASHPPRRRDAGGGGMADQVATMCIALPPGTVSPSSATRCTVHALDGGQGTWGGATGTGVPMGEGGGEVMAMPWTPRAGACSVELPPLPPRSPLAAAIVALMKRAAGGEGGPTAGGGVGFKRGRGGREGDGVRSAITGRVLVDGWEWDALERSTFLLVHGGASNSDGSGEGCGSRGGMLEQAMGVGSAAILHADTYLLQVVPADALPAVAVGAATAFSATGSGVGRMAHTQPCVTAARHGGDEVAATMAGHETHANAAMTWMAASGSRRRSVGGGRGGSKAAMLPTVPEVGHKGAAARGESEGDACEEGDDPPGGNVMRDRGQARAHPAITSLVRVPPPTKRRRSSGGEEEEADGCSGSQGDGNSALEARLNRLQRVLDILVERMGGAEEVGVHDALTTPAPSSRGQGGPVVKGRHAPAVSVAPAPAAPSWEVPTLVASVCEGVQAHLQPALTSIQTNIRGLCESVAGDKEAHTTLRAWMAATVNTAVEGVRVAVEGQLKEVGMALTNRDRDVITTAEEAQKATVALQTSVAAVHAALMDGLAKESDVRRELDGRQADLARLAKMEAERALLVARLAELQASHDAAIARATAAEERAAGAAASVGVWERRVQEQDAALTRLWGDVRAAVRQRQWAEDKLREVQRAMAGVASGGEGLGGAALSTATLLVPAPSSTGDGPAVSGLGPTGGALH